MAINSSAARVRAEANFRKEERLKDGAKAMIEYQDRIRVIREKMMHLRTLRLAKENAEKQHGPTGKPTRAKSKS